MITKAEAIRTTQAIAVGALGGVQLVQIYCGQNLPTSFRDVQQIVLLMLMAVMSVSIVIDWRDGKKMKEAQPNV